MGSESLVWPWSARCLTMSSPAMCQPALQPEQGCGQHAAYGIGQQIDPAGVSPGQKGLMPFIQGTGKDCARNTANGSAPAARAGCKGEGTADQRKGHDMRQLVPRRREQPHG